MAAGVLDRPSVAKNKREKPTETRDRIDLRADSDWIERVSAVAERFGLSLSAYIRLATTERLERDEAAAKQTKSR